MIHLIKNYYLKRQKALEIRDNLIWSCDRKCIIDGNRILIYGKNLEELQIIRNQIWWWLFFKFQIRDRESKVYRDNNVYIIEIEKFKHALDKDWAILRKLILNQLFKIQS